MPLELNSAEYNQVLDWIRRGLKAANDNRSELARRIGVSPQRIWGWQNPETRYEPQSLPMLKLIDLVLQHEAQEKPQADPFMIREDSPVYGHTTDIRLVGHVSAGQLSMSDASDVDYLAFADLWRDSPWWHYTDAQQPVLLVQVRGDSMAPTYPDKSLIAVRKPSLKKLPNGAPCVFRDGAEVTFKLLMRRDDGGIAGLPLNQDYDLVSFRNPEVDYVALGSIQPRMSVSMMFSPPPISKKRNHR